MTGDAETRPPTDAELADAADDIAQLKRDLAAARDRPKPPVTGPGKFSGAIGLDKDGNLQPPLTEQERAHLAEVRRPAVEDTAPDE